MDAMDPWEAIKGSSFADAIRSKLFEIGGDWYALVFWVGVIGLVCSGFALAFNLITKRRGDDVAIAKDGFTTKVIIALIIFAFPTLLGLFMAALESLSVL